MLFDWWWVSMLTRLENLQTLLKVANGSRNILVLQSTRGVFTKLLGLCQVIRRNIRCCLRKKQHGMFNLIAHTNNRIWLIQVKELSARICVHTCFFSHISGSGRGSSSWRRWSICCTSTFVAWWTPSSATSNAKLVGRRRCCCCACVCRRI